MNVLHLVDPGGIGGGALTLRYVADLLLVRGRDDVVIVIGHRGDARLAQRCGLRVDALAPVPRSPRFGLTPGMRDVVNRLVRRHGGPEVVHAWSRRAEALAARILPETPCAVSAMVGPVLERSMAKRIGAQLAPAVLSRRGQLRFFVPHAGVQRELVSAGVFEEMAWVVEPGVDMSLLAAHRQRARAALRRTWGVEDDELLVGLITQPVQWGHARAAASIVTLPVTANRRVKLLVHPEAMRLHDAYEWARPLDLDRYLVQDADLAEPWRVLAGLDVALWLGNPHTEFGGNGAAADHMQFGRQPEPGVLPILWACASGLPVMAERCSTTERLIRDGENGLLIEPHDVPAGARHAIALFDDPELRNRLGAAGRRDVEARFTIAHAAKRLDDAYSRLLEAQRACEGQDDEPLPATAVRSPSSASAAST